MIIDAKGKPCPKPVLMADDALSKINEGIIEILVDNEVSEKNITRYANSKGYYVESEKFNDHWRIKIVKGFPCEIPNETTKSNLNNLIKEEEKGLLLIIATSTMGRDEKLGEILMKAFFETILVTREFPHTIFFMNTGVYLTTIKEEYLEILKKLEELCVEIYTCGTCLKYFDLEDKLKVGKRGGTNHIVEGMRDFKKIVWVD